MKRYLPLLFAAALCLLSGCGGRSVTTRLVISSMGVDCAASPLTAVLEIIKEEQNELMTVQGESFAELFSAAERQSGEQLYLGALQSIVFSGIADGSTLRAYLFSLMADGRIAPNIQIALCDDALSVLSEDITGDDITALLTCRYTDCRSCGLKEFINLLDGEGRDGLLPWLSTEEGKLRESGFLPTGSSDYTEPLPPDDLCRLLLRRTDETRRALSVDGSEVTVLLRRLAVSGVRYEQRETEVNLSAEVTVQAVNGTVPTRAALETALRNDLLKQLEMLENTVMHSRRSDILGLAARAALAGFDADAIDLSRITFVPRFVLRDPRGLLA